MEYREVERRVIGEWQKMKPRFSDVGNDLEKKPAHSWESSDMDALEDYAQRSFRRFSLLAHRIHTHLPEGSKILDAGAGSGLLAKSLKAIGYDATASEITPDMPGLRDGDVPFRQWHLEAEPAPFEDHAFDAVILSQTMEHFTFGPKQTVEEFLRIVKPGGLILLDVPNISSFRNISRLLRGKSLHWDFKKNYLEIEPAITDGIPYYDRHNHEYSMEDMAAIAAYFELQIIESGYYSSYDARRGNVAVALAKFRDSVHKWRHYLYALYRTPS